MQFGQLNRRKFITAVGSAVAWPLAARAQQTDQVRRIGVLMSTAANDPEGQDRIAAFLHELQQLGWTDGRNLQIDYRRGAGDTDLTRRYAAELLALAPDVILASSPLVLVPLRDATRTIPIVFAAVSDPVAAGFVASLARPGGNATGFSVFEYGFSVKWLELLKELAPHVTRVAVLQELGNPGGLPQFAAVQAVAPSLRVEVSTLWMRDAAEIEQAVTAFARSPNGGLIATRTTGAIVHRDLIIFVLIVRLPKLQGNPRQTKSRYILSAHTDETLLLVDRVAPSVFGPPRELCFPHHSAGASLHTRR